MYFRIFNELYAPLHSTADDIDDEEATGEASMSMAQTALLLMLELEREPLFFTRKGQLQKNSRDRMLRVFTQKEQEAGTNGRLPCFVEESLDLMLRMGIVKIEDGMTAVQRSKYMSWLEMNGTEREEIMFMIWYRVHGPLDARLQWLTAALWQAPAGKWVAMEHVLHRMREAGLSIAFEQV